MRFLLRSLPAWVALTALFVGVSPASASVGAGGPRLAQPGLQVGVPLDPINAPVPRFPNNPAQAYLVADLTTGEVLAGKNAYQKLYPASTLKALVALALLPRLDPEMRYTATKADAQVEGTKIRLIAGRKYRVDALMHALMIESGNDAGLALANAAGGLPAALKIMNQEARRIQALGTVAKNPHGLNAVGQTTTAYDMALIAKAGLARPDFAKIVKTQKYVFRDQGTKPRTRTVYNHNRLLPKYPGMIGVKNGYTRAAGNTYIGAAKRDGRTIVVTLLRLTPNYSRDKVATAMLDWGFAAAGKIEPVGTLVDPIGPAFDEKIEVEVTNFIRQAAEDTSVPKPLKMFAVPMVLVAALRARVLIRRRLRRRRRQLARTNPIRA
jgi:serine-type D-Ala-D-Ala carboxypeptidase (penicillin-binding protein 5/6)